MKILVAVVLLTLICIVHRSAGSFGARGIGETCCPGVTQTRIPKGRIRNVVMTPRDCELKAIIVTTVCDKKVCFDQKSDWARTVLDEFQESTANNTSPSPPFNVFKCNEKKKP